MFTQTEDRAGRQTVEGERAAASTCQSMVRHPRETIEHVIRDSPATATLTAFGIGLGLGAIVGCLLANRGAERRHLATSLGSRMLDSVGEYLPQSIQQRIGR